MRLNNYITELAMKKDTDIKRAKKKDQYYNAKITLSTGDVWYYNATNDFGEDNWNISFYGDSLSPGVRGDKHKVALETFAAVEKLTKEFLKEFKPNRFYFSASGVSRIKLYQTLVKKILKDATYKEAPHDRTLQGHHWRFIRKEK